MTMAAMVEGMAARGSPVTAQPIVRPRAPSRTTTKAASRNELRRFSPMRS